MAVGNLIALEVEIYDSRRRCLVLVGFESLEIHHLAISVRTLSCLHLYQPSPSAFLHPVKIWFNVHSVAPHFT